MLDDYKIVLRRNNIIPIVEHSYNRSRIGITEINMTLFDGINMIRSTLSDLIVDKANELIVFENVELTNEQVTKFLRNGAIIIPPSASKVGDKSSVYTIKMSFNLSETEMHYKDMIVASYGIVGVPIPISNTTSGNDTGVARSMGAGWDSAYEKIKIDQIKLLEGDYKVLIQMINCSKLLPESQFKDTDVNDIEIKYNITPKDNIDTKFQALSLAYSVNLPLEMALERTNLSLDPKRDALKWQKYIDEIANKNVKVELIETVNEQNASTIDNKVKSSGNFNADNINKKEKETQNDDTTRTYRQ